MPGNIDERIVSMLFDNKQFEAGIRQSQQSIQNFEQNLDLSKVSSNVEKIGSKFSALGAVTASALFRATNAAIDFGGKLISNVLDPIFQGGNRRATNIEQAKFQIKGLGESWDALRPHIDRAVDGTAYGLDEAAKVASSLLASQVPMEKMGTSLRAVSGLAAMTGRDYMSMGDVFSKVAGQGRLMGDDLNRIGAGGVNAAAALVRYFKEVQGITDIAEADVRKMVSEGKVNFETFAAAMDHAFGEHATKANETYAGSLANVRSALARIGEATAAAKLEYMRDFFNDLRPQLNEVNKGLKPIMAQIGAIKGDIWRSFGKAVASIDLSKWVEGGPKIAESLGLIWEATKKWITPIADAFKRVFGSNSDTGNGFIRFADRMADFAKKITPSQQTLEKVGAAFEKFFEIIKRSGEVVWGILKKVGSVLGDIFSGTTTAGLEGGNTVIEFFKAFAQAVGEFLKGGVDRVPKLMEGLVDAFKALFTEGWDNLGNFASGFGDLAGSAIRGIGQAISDVISWVSENISLKSIIGAMLGYGSTKLLLSVSGIIDQVRDFVGAIKSIFKPAEEVSEKKGLITDLFEQVGTAIGAFQRAVNVAAIAAIAGSILMLALSLKMLSNIHWKDLVKGLGAMAAMMGMLMLTFKTMANSLRLGDVKGMVASATALLIVSFALRNMAKALEDMGNLKPAEITKGLITLGGVLFSLGVFMKQVSGSKLGMGSAITLLALAQALKMISGVLEDMGNLSWTQISKGLVTMAGSLLVMGSAISALGKGGFGNLVGATSLLVAVQSLKDIATGLEQIGSLSWEQISKGLLGMMGAIFLFEGTLNTLGKSDKWAILGQAGASVSLLIAVQSLYAIATAMERLSYISWEGLAKGVSGITVAIAAISGITTAAGSVNNGLASLAGGGALLVAAQSLYAIGSYFEKVSGLRLEGVATAMGGIIAAVAAISGITTAAGSVNYGLASLAGGGALLVAAQSLYAIGSYFEKVAGLDLNGVSGAMDALLAAVLTLSGITTAAGSIAYGIPALVGSGSLLLAVQGLDEIADYFISISSLNWDQISNGLGAMAGAMANIAWGSLVNSLSALGGWSIGVAGAALVELAEGMKAFADVPPISKNIASDLTDLSQGVLAWTFAGFGNMAMNGIGQSLVELATGVKAWDGVTLSGGLRTGLEDLAHGVQAWTFAGVGGWSMSGVGDSLGELARGVRAWSGINSLPTGMNTTLAELSDGVQSWTWAKAGGWAMDGVGNSLSELATGVKAFSTIDGIPPNMNGMLTQLAEGIQSFDSLSTLIGSWAAPGAGQGMINLAEGVRAWVGIETLPGNLKQNLIDLANGIEEFGTMSGLIASWSTQGIGEGMASLATGVKAWDDVTVSPELAGHIEGLGEAFQSFGTIGNLIASWGGVNVGPQLGQLADGVKKWNGVELGENVEGDLMALARGIGEFWNKGFSAGALETIAPALGIFAESVKKWSGVTVKPEMVTNLGTLADALGEFESVGDLSSVASGIGALVGQLNGFNTAISGKSSSITAYSTSMSNMSKGLPTSASNIENGLARIKNAFQNDGTQIVTGANDLATRIKDAMNKVKDGVNTASNDVVTAINNMRDKMVSAMQTASNGVNGAARSLTSGLISTLSSAYGGVYSSAYSVGTAVSQGMASGIYGGSYMVTSAARSVAQSALSAAKASLGVHSPSREFAWIGEQSDEGFALGLLGNVSVVQTAARDTGLAAIEALKDSLSKTPEMLVGDLNPRITPVLDLSQLSKDAQGIGSLFGGLDLSNALALAEVAYSEAEQVTNAAVGPRQSDSFNFYQYNNSPKALSDIEIYRQTRNQLALAKQALAEDPRRRK